MTTISATDLARKTRAILDLVVGRGETVEIERNNVAIARLIPSEPSMTATQALSGLTATLTPEQGADWLKDSRESFREDIRDPWG